MLKPLVTTDQESHFYLSDFGELRIVYRQLSLAIAAKKARPPKWVTLSENEIAHEAKPHFRARSKPRADINGRLPFRRLRLYYARLHKSYLAS